MTTAQTAPTTPDGTALAGRPTLRPAAGALVLVLLLALTLAGNGLTTAAAAPARAGTASVIVRARPGALDSTVRLVQELGGRVGRRLGVINGFSAQLPAGQLAPLVAAPGVAAVISEEPVAMQAAAYAPTTDAGSLHNTTLATGAQAYWKAGYTGKGVDVAVVDTGTAPVPGLATAGKVVNGPDLSFESQAPNLRYRTARRSDRSPGRRRSKLPESRRAGRRAITRVDALQVEARLEQARR